MSSVPHMGGVIVTSLNQIGDLAKGELRAWLEPWFETRGPTVGVVSGATADRPTFSAVGRSYFDTTLGKPIWWNGSVWKDATGATV